MWYLSWIVVGLEEAELTNTLERAFTFYLRNSDLVVSTRLTLRYAAEVV